MIRVWKMQGLGRPGFELGCPGAERDHLLSVGRPWLLLVRLSGLGFKA